jgi:hypothetical protein
VIFVPDAKRTAEFRLSDLDEQLSEGAVGKRAGYFKIIGGGHEKGTVGLKGWTGGVVRPATKMIAETNRSVKQYFRTRGR